jgi:N-ethylmaleimide reductase
VTNRLRFLNEVLDAVGHVMPIHRVGIRLSPSSTWMDVLDPEKEALYSALVRNIHDRGLAYLHLVEPGIAGAMSVESDPAAIPSADLGRLFEGPVIVTGGLSAESAAALVADGVADLVGFGRLFIANPDLPHRFRHGSDLAELRPDGLYSGDEAGYTDYPHVHTPE